MTWLYVPPLSAPVSAASISASTTPCDPSAPAPVLWSLLNGKPIAQPLSWPGWKDRSWISRLSGTILDPSTVRRFADAWISSLPASLANQQASPVSAAAPPTIDGSGQTSGEPRSPVERRCCFSRTCQGCSRSTMVRPSRRSSNAWPRAGGLRSGIAFPQEPSAPRTSAIVSTCSVPTPTASVYGSSQNGINGKGGQFERPSAGTMSLYTMARRGLIPGPDGATLSPGGPLSPHFTGWLLGLPMEWHVA